MDLTEVMVKAYQEGASLRQCAERFGVDRHALKDALKAAGHAIKSKSQIEAHRHDGPWRDAALMRDLYEVKKLPTRRIAEQFGCDKSVIVDWLARHGINTRTTAETQRGKIPKTKGTGKRHNEETVLCECGCGTEIRRFSWSSRETRFAPGHTLRGTAHPLYKPLSVNRDRLHEGSDYRQWRRSVLAKDAFTCACCGKVGGRLHAHHVIPAAHRPEFLLESWNGKAVCKPCHKEIHAAAREVL